MSAQSESEALFTESISTKDVLSRLRLLSLTNVLLLDNKLSLSLVNVTEDESEGESEDESEGESEDESEGETETSDSE